MEKNIIYASDSRQMRQIPDGVVALTLTRLSRSKDDEDAHFSLLCAVFREVVRVTLPGGKICVIHDDIMLLASLADFLRTMDTYLYARIILHDTSVKEQMADFNSDVMHGEYQYLHDYEHLHVYRKGRKARTDKSSEDGRYITKSEWKKSVSAVWDSDPSAPQLFFENCIVLYSFPDDLVLDPFATDGGVLLSAKKLGRYHVGYDSDAHRMKTATEILSQVDFASHPTLRIKDRTPKMKKSSLSEIALPPPDFEKLDSSARDERLEAQLTDLISSGKDFIEGCEDFSADLIDAFILNLQKEYFVQEQPFTELANKYPGINKIHLIIELGGWGALREGDKKEIEKYFKDKGVENLLEYTAFELKEFEKGRRLATIRRWRGNRLETERAKEARKKGKERNQMDKPKQGATAKARSKRREKKIRALPGKNNILVIAPHGRFHDDDYTNIIAEELSEVFGCYAVINEKYRRPRKKKKERRDPHKLILDLNLIEDAKLVAGNEYLDKIDEYSKTIANSDDPIVFYIHGIKKENIERAARISKDYKGEPGDLQILVGYGQKGVKNPPFTAEEKTVTALIKGLEAPPGSFAVIRAPLDDIPVDNEKKSYCGNSPRGMNQYFAQNGIAVQSIQLEIRNKGLREDPANARETAGLIGKAISALIVEIEKPGEREGWTTLSKKPEMKQIRVGEIDLNDKKFIIRTPELWFDEEKMDWLASTIKAGGIHQNIIVRRTPGRDGYQIISGFRRLRALQKVMQEDGGENKFEDQEIWAEVYDHSLSDEEAFRVSLSENLAREDLSAWEIAKSLRTIREELGKNGKTPGAIVKRLAGMINKKPKTVARFLQIGTIENEDLRKAIHKGEVDFSTALVFAREEFTEDDRAALYGFYKGQSISFNQFNSYVKNLLELRKSLGITVSEILDLPMARTLLETDPRELKEKAGELEETQGESPQEILKTIADGVKIPDAGTPSRAEYSQFVKRFSKKAEPIERKINRHLAGDNLPAKFSLKPSKDFDSKAINLHIRSPLQDAQRVLAIVSVDLENSLPSLEPVFKQLPKQDESPDNPKTPSATERTEYSVSTQEVPGLTDRPAAPALTASNPQSPSIAFTMNLADLQDVLKTLRKIAGPPDGLMGEILVRTLPKNRVQFGRVHAQSWNENGLLVDKVVADSQEGCVAPMLSEIYDPIMRLMGGENTECEINGFREGAKSSRKAGILTIKFKGTELQLSFPTYKPDRIVSWFDAHRPPAPLISLEDSSELVKSLNKVLVCIEPNHPREAMTVVNFKTDGSYLRLVGSNGAKLHEIGWSHNGESGQKIERILPYNYAHSLKQIMRKVKGPVAICLSDKGIFFQTDGLLLVGKFWTHEKYPDYEALFAAGSDSFVLPVSDLREISASMSEYADQIDNSRMTLSTSQDRVEFKSDGKAVEKSAHQMQGKMVVDINAKFLADLVKHMDGEMVEIRYVDDKCITFHPNTGRERAFLSSLRRREPEKPPEKVQKNKATGTPE